MSPIDNHKFDYFVQYLADRFTIIFVSILTLLFGLGFSIQLGNDNYINRFGGVIVILGLLLTMSPFFLNGIYKSQSACGRWASMDANGKTLTTTETERYIGDNVFYGVILSIFGTIINNFGDLIFF